MTHLFIQKPQFQVQLYIFKKEIENSDLISMHSWEFDFILMHPVLLHEFCLISFYFNFTNDLLNCNEICFMKPLRFNTQRTER